MQPAAHRLPWRRLCQTAEIHIRIAPKNGFNALGTTEIDRAA
ncbi:hypothetical protein [Paenirhodobacter hankyongi]|nr:hypothetical protein [Sinirhodobacter hankyongi]